jgi:hypothetical protein
MADGFIVRRGGKVSEQALAPTITEVSVTDSSITFTIKNEDTEKAIIRYRIDDIDAEGEIIELAGGATSNNITASGLDGDTTYTVFATANVTGKVKSNVTQLAIETDEPIIFTAATGGTTEEYNLNGKRYRSHTFTSNGTFEVTTVGDADGDRNKVDYLIIAGGGGGGFNGGAGGGAGGYRTTFGTQGGLGTLDSKVTVTATSYGVTVGLGGAGGTANGVAPSGVNSSISFPTTITSTGGGGGNNTGDGGNGGSGGGSASTTTRGLGTANQGFDGGLANATTPVGRGGGGGAGEIGGDGKNPEGGGDGGDGLSSIIRTGSAEFRAGGGGGGARVTGGIQGSGGVGGGGAGGYSDQDPAATAGTANTGGGGGGGASGSIGYAGANGGSGIVIIRYEIAPSV